MRQLILGAVLGVLWLLVGVPLTPALAVLAAVVQPVTIAFVLGVTVGRFASVSLTGARRWTA